MMVAAIAYTLLAFSALTNEVAALAVPKSWGHCPNGQNCDRRPSWGWPWKAWPHMSQSLAQHMPSLTGLPSNSNATLKYTAIGLGVQNYTCANSSATPKANGALAVLYDTSHLFARDQQSIDNITTKYLQAYEAESCTRFGKPPLKDNCCEDEVNRSQDRLRTLGHHFFETRDGKGVPFFHLGHTHPKHLLSAQLISSVKPTTTPQNNGANGQGAVAWLFLTDDQSGQSSGLSEVYRVQTAGGVPDPNACQNGQPEFGVKYSAQYWFFD